MPADCHDDGAGRDRRRKGAARLPRRTFAAPSTPKRLALGYPGQTLPGWLMLSLTAAQVVPVGVVDTLFIAVSAALPGLVSSVLRRRQGDRLFDHDLPAAKVRLAAAGLCLCRTLVLAARAQDEAPHERSDIVV